MLPGTYLCVFTAIMCHNKIQTRSIQSCKRRASHCQQQPIKSSEEMQRIIITYCLMMSYSVCWFPYDSTMSSFNSIRLHCPLCQMYLCDTRCVRASVCVCVCEHADGQVDTRWVLISFSALRWDTDLSVTCTHMHTKAYILFCSAVIREARNMPCIIQGPAMLSRAPCVSVCTLSSRPINQIKGNELSDNRESLAP